VAEVRQVAADGNLSAFVNEVLRWHLQNIRLRGYLNLREEAGHEWDALKASWNEARYPRSRPGSRGHGQG
jgi:hypothetical protein